MSHVSSGGRGGRRAGKGVENVNNDTMERGWRWPYLEKVERERKRKSQTDVRWLREREIDREEITAHIYNFLKAKKYINLSTTTRWHNSYLVKLFKNGLVYVWIGCETGKYRLF